MGGEDDRTEPRSHLVSAQPRPIDRQCDNLGHDLIPRLRRNGDRHVQDTEDIIIDVGPVIIYYSRERRCSCVRKGIKRVYIHHL